MLNIKYGAPLFNTVVIITFFFICFAVRGVNGLAESNLEDEVASILGILAVPLILAVIVTGIAGLIKGNVKSYGGYFITTFSIIAIFTIIAQVR